MVRTIVVFLAVILSAFSATRADDAANKQIAFLNHIFFVADQAQADAIANSSALGEFAAREIRTVKAGGGRSWSARYLHGQNTYLEFFGPNDGGPGPKDLHRVGIALSADTPGVANRVFEHLEEAGLRPTRKMRRRRLDDGSKVNWFTSVSIDDANKRRTRVWFIEYDIDYMNSTKEQAEKPSDLISRERYNPDTYRDREMRDVTAISVRSTREDFDLAAHIFSAAGYSVVADKSRAVVSGLEMTFNFEFTPAPEAGLESIEFALNDDHGVARTIEIGNSELIVGDDGFATWKFHQPIREH